MFSFKWKKCILFILALTCLFVFYPARALAEDSGYTIGAYDVNVKVNQNNVLDVTEKITADFAMQKHGIYRYLPVISSATRTVEGRQVVSTHRIIISGISVTDGAGNPVRYQSSRDGDNLVLKIGNPNVYLIGRQTYVISYRYDIGADNIKKFDDLYYNIIGNQWDTRISGVSFRIDMPESFDPSLISFTAGSRGSADASAVKYQVSGDTIAGNVSRTLQPGEGVTLRLELPNGYFKGAREGGSVSYPFLIAVSAALMAIAVLLYFLYGRDEPVYTTVEVYPPEDMTSADAGYIIDGYVDNRDIVSLIIYWADKGYLSITDTKSKQFTLNKLKEPDRAMRDYEKFMFEELFRGRSSVSAQDLQYQFYQTINTTRSRIIGSYEGDAQRRIYTKKGNMARVLCLACAGLCSAFQIFFAAKDYYFSLSAGMIAGAVAFAIIAACAGLFGYTVDKSKSGSIAKIFFAALPLVFCSFIIALVCIGFSDMVIPSLLGAAAAVVCGIIAGYARKRTHVGSLWLGKLLGLKRFIQMAEKSRIEMLVEENPSYFYTILPFAYVLGVTDKWAKKFESITVAPPEWLHTGNPDLFTTLYLTSMLNSNLAVYQRNMAAVPQSSGSNGGGGFGGMGGGGFSGGGFGGGGGGSW